MIKQGGGSIINMTSAAGVGGGFGHGGYAATKHAIEGLSKVMAAEFKRYNIAVNWVDPGSPRLLDTPAARADMPKEHERILSLLPAETMNPLAVFLASQDGSGVTGERIVLQEWLETDVGRKWADLIPIR
jgi:3alpha(or 20beta)-hydroxysteroid dehydrogenase